jgi:uncharacterized protein
VIVMEPVDVRDLLAHPGASRRVAKEERFTGMKTELAAVPEERPVRIEVLLESVIEGVLVSGPLSGEISYRCARCLKDFGDDFRVEVRELYSPHANEERDEYPIRDGQIDLEPMVRDAVVLAMPFSPLCRPDCLGLCPRCGGDRNLGECSCGPEIDPRWAALERLDLEET